MFQNLRSTDGLSSKVIRSLYKDKDGFLWIGTAQGLNRYDGAVVKQYKGDQGVKDLYINALNPLGEDEIIVGTRLGIRIFDKKEGAFRYDGRFAALDDEEIFILNEDPQRTIWIVTSKNVYLFKQNRLLPLEAEIPEASIIRDHTHSNAVLTWDNKRKGFWLAGVQNFFIDHKAKRIYHKADNPQQLPILDKGNVFAIAIDKNDNIWFGCNDDKSLNFWDDKTGQLTTYFELDGQKIFGGCNYIFIDKKDRIWISTWAYTAYFKEPGKAIKQIPYSQNRIYSIGYNFFRNAIEDVEGNIWLATINGISKVQPETPVQAIYQLPSFKYFLHTGFAHANSIVVDGDQIMAAKEEGMVMFSMQDQTYKRYVVTEGDDWVRNRFLMSVKRNETWWCAGIDGIYYLEPGSDVLKPFTKIRYLPETRYSNFIFLDKSGKLWFQVWNDAIYRFDPDSGHLDRFDGKDSRYGTFHFANSQSFLVRRNGDILFAMNEFGFLKFDALEEKFTFTPVNDPRGFIAHKMVEDGRQNTWAVVWGRGIVKFNKNGDQTDSLNTSNGFQYDHLSSIAMDKLGSLWVTGNEGLFFFSPLTKLVTKVSVELGQNLQDYWNNLYITRDRVYAIMLDHVVVIDPSKFAAISVKKAPHITSLKVYGNEKQDFGKYDRVDLKNDEDYLTFQYASLDHRNVSTLQYSYILEGFDKEWIKVGRSLVASYKNLPWGNYTFKVRSTDEHGNWMAEVGSIQIYIQPPWWFTNWFIACALIAAALLGLGVLRNFKERKRKLLFETSVDYFANSVYGQNSVNEICWDIARNCITLLHFEDCVVYLMDYKKNVLVQKAAYGSKNPKGLEIVIPIEIPLGKGIVGIAATTAKPVLIPDTSKDPRYIVDEVRRYSELAVPILHEGKVIGVLDSEHTSKNYFKPEHLKALSIITTISASKIAEALAQAVTREKELELLEINKLLAESQLMALRAQMNPHFVFNCLNSIQECIVTDKFGEAGKYLNLFSKLFRKVLNNSGKKLVDLDEERTVLEMYLQLEEMRFEKSFSYQIEVDQDLAEEEVLIPSMLIQPYVENALWHGLMHSQSERKLLIEFRRIDEEIFECRIDDNGIGRKKSFEIKELSSKTRHHESKGLRISDDRLGVIRRQGYHANVRFVDKEDADGNATGTLVIVELSSFLK